MSALDTSVVNTILPLINRTLQSDIATVQWVVTVYLLLVSGLLPAFGRLGDLKGHKSVYIGGFLLFIFSSILCGLATSVYLLVAYRALQAVAAAMLSANSPAILTKNFPASQRGQALGMQATMTYLGLTVGPSAGGWLAEQFGWSSVFYINVPVGLLAMLLAILAIQKDHGAQSEEGFDWPGALLFLAGLVSLLLALNQGHNWGWGSVPILGLLLAALLLLAWFLRREQTISAPMLDLRLFKSRLFSSSITSAVLNYICTYSIIFLMPFYLIDGRSLSPAQAGLFLTALPLSMAIVAPISGTLSDRIGTRIPTTLGMALLAGGLYLLARLGGGSPPQWLIMRLCLSGLGIGMFIAPNNSALMGSAPTHRQGIAAGLMATARNVGMVLGVGLAGAIFTTSLAREWVDQNQRLFVAVQHSFSAMIVVALVGLLIAAMRQHNPTHLHAE